MNTVQHGDCLELMKSIPDGSVDMILCDPPYGNMRGAGLDGWDQIKTDWDIKLNTSQMLEEYNRVLRLNGCVVLFSQEPLTSEFISSAHGNLPFSYRMIWLKDHFANALISKTAPVSYFEDLLVFFKKYDTQLQHPLRSYSKAIFDFIGKTKQQLFEEMGNQGVCHFMRYDSMQFQLCTGKTYTQLCEKYHIDAQSWFKSFSELEEINRRFIRRFNLSEGKKYKSNVLSYRKDYLGMHPTQKPVALIEDLIRTYTNEGETVLDNCAGSGTTAIACINTNRNYILMEKEQKYYDIILDRIEKHKPQLKMAI